MRVHFIQHVPFEGLGSIAAWLADAGHAVTGTLCGKNATLPGLDAVDLLILMGGPMSVHDEHLFPWLRGEKQFVRDCIQAGKAVLGICLGAQLVAEVLGGRVYPNGQKEIGWFPVRGRASRDEGCFPFGDSEMVFHWHGETFTLPHGATLLATSEACVNQAFQYGERVIALQFHLEATPESVAGMIEHCGHEIVPAPFVQTAAQMTERTRLHAGRANRLMEELLTYLTRP
jgi:GMP synthase-like glutamine amidotransferase